MWEASALGRAASSCRSTECKGLDKPGALEEWQ